jgi:DNA-binding transcriptional LysR family regulator
LWGNSQIAAICFENVPIIGATAIRRGERQLARSCPNDQQDGRPAGRPYKSDFHASLGVNMELRQLRYFLAVAEQLHFTRAAELLHVAQPALSQQIAMLEQEIGVKLLERTNRRVELTPAGHAFKVKAQSALDQVSEAASDAKKVDVGEGGSVTIGFISSAALVILPKLLVRFCDRVPAATFDIRVMDPGMQLEAMHHRKIDLGLTSVLSNYPDLEYQLLLREPLIVALPEGHPATRHRSVDLKWLADERILLPPRYGLTGLHDRIVAACHEAGFIPGHAQPIRLVEIAIFLVAGGVGIALTPSSFLKLQVKGVVYRPLKQQIIFELFAFRRKRQNTELLDRLWSELAAIDSW